MGYKKPTEVSRMFLENASLPNHADSYTVISHKFVMDNTTKLLTDSGFKITKEVFRANQGANVAQGIYYITPSTLDSEINNESELGMMFAWTNSYDKSIRFQCSIGAYVMVCNNGMVCGEMNFSRKHTGTADLDIISQISSQIKNAEKTFKRILADRDNLKNIELSKKQQAELAGRLYYEHEILEPTQLTIIKSEMEKASFDYSVDQTNAWAFYNHVTHALKKTHPRSWLSNTKEFHDFITVEFLSNNNFTNNDSIKIADFDVLIDESHLVEVDFESTFAAMELSKMMLE
jgi:hypothetical protein